MVQARVKDAALLAAVAFLNRRRLARERRGGPEAQQERQQQLLEELSRSPLALHTREANEQHYELPAAFFERVLGPHRKYSSAYWTRACRTLGQAEEAMLELYRERALLREGDRILELGCGWGSLTEAMAHRFPGARIMALSNSNAQRECIHRLGLANVQVVTADINDFDPGRRFDRIVSVEMFEHLRNYPLLFRKLRDWLEPDGKLFFHVFCHRTLAYLFEGNGWMERHFFRGGTMPSSTMFLSGFGQLDLERFWLVDGRHYSRTALAWLYNLRRERGPVLEIFRTVYGREARQWFFRWELFFLACAGLFGFADGTEWMLAHYRFRQRP
ncbi:MAG: cyclopropane-fatty-acyl-phospholipid synthase family protein [Candidatus Eremiobacterota bacterium]